MIEIKRFKEQEQQEFKKPSGSEFMFDWTDMIGNAIDHRFENDDKERHMCFNCERYFDLEYDRTTQDENACEYLYQAYLSNPDEIEEEDNGGGYWIVKCPNFIEMDTKRLYNRWMKSDAWRAIAAEKKKRALYKCELCGSAINLCVHHTTYKNLCREYDHMEDLIVVCKSCHEALHEADMRQTNEVKE